MIQNLSSPIYQSPGSNETIQLTTDDSHISASVDERKTLELVWLKDQGQLELIRSPAGSAQERLLLRVLEYIFGQDRSLQTIDISTLPGILSDGRARGLVIEREGRPCVDREAFFQNPALWSRATAPEFRPERWTSTADRRHPERPSIAPGVVYRRRLPSEGQTLTIELFDRSKHLDIFHDWQNQPRVSAFWEMDFSREKLDEYIAAMENDRHQRPMIVSLEGKPVGYVEAYWTPENRLGPYYEYDPFDRGYHFLIGDTTVLGTQVTPDFISSVVHWLFLDDARTRRIMGEPRSDNVKLLRYVQSLGWTKLKEFDFPHKRAALLQMRREDFFKGGRI